MSEIQIVEILSKGGITLLLILTVYYLHKQYSSSIERFYEREREFYQNISQKLNEIADEIKRRK